MKRFGLIAMLLAFYLNSYCQKQSFFDTSFAYTSSEVFFKNNPVIDSIIVWNDGYSVYLKTKLKSSTSFNTKFNSYDYYNSNFLGDIYRFENRYGKLPLPEKDLVLLATRGCSKWCRSKVVLSAGLIKYQLTCTCPSNEPSDDYDFVFTKVETFARIKNGISELQKQIQNSFDKIKKATTVASKDSVLIYKILVDRKDSCLQEIELTEGQPSPFEYMVMDVLKHACLWLPAEQGGRPVTFISSVFVRLNKDESITVDIVK